MSIEILFEDNHILGLNKPPDIATQGEHSLEESARLFIKERDHKPGNAFIFAVHRLDKAACGIVIFAKSQKALSRLSASIRSHLWHKQYTAIVEGSRPQVGKYIDHLVHGDHKAYISTDREAKRAELDIVSVQPHGKYWLITIRLYTGRYHQIRAQLSARGWPILGDHIYGSYVSTQLHLHHTTCSFPHPIQANPITVVAPCPFLVQR